MTNSNSIYDDDNFLVEFQFIENILDNFRFSINHRVLCQKKIAKQINVYEFNKKTHIEFNARGHAHQSRSRK